MTRQTALFNNLITTNSANSRVQLGALEARRARASVRGPVHHVALLAADAAEVLVALGGVLLSVAAAAVAHLARGRRGGTD